MELPLELPEPTGRDVDDPSESLGVVGVVGESEIGEDVLDLSTVEEVRAAEHPVGKLMLAEGEGELLSLPVRPVEDRDLARALDPPSLRGDETVSAATNSASDRSSCARWRTEGEPSGFSVQRVRL